MKHDEWLEVGRKQLGLWPSQPWEPPTMAAAYDLFREVPASFALQALELLAAEGREFSPMPGVVLSKALQLVIAATPALPDPDLTRVLTPEEADRARRMAAALNGDKARLVQATWMDFARHARRCSECGPVADRCRRPGPSRQADSWISEVCAEGRPLWESWREAVFDLNAFDVVQVEAPL